MNSPKTRVRFPSTGFVRWWDTLSPSLRLKPSDARPRSGRINIGSGRLGKNDARRPPITLPVRSRRARQTPASIAWRESCGIWDYPAGRALLRTIPWLASSLFAKSPHLIGDPYDVIECPRID